MITFRASLLVLLTLLAVGCATTKTSDLVYGQKCRTPSTFTKIKTTDIKIEALEKREFYELTPTKIFSGIKSVNLHDSKLTLSLFDNAYFEQYSAPVINLVRKSHYEAHPFRAIFGTILFAGLPWIVAPSDYSDFAFGCTQASLITSKSDLTKKVKTGRSEWRGTQKTHKILISGFDKDHEASSISNEEEIELSPYILNTDLTKNTTMKITCLDCDLLSSEEQSLYKDVKKTVLLNADFRAIKATLIESKELDSKPIVIKPEKTLTPNPNTGKLE